MQSRIGILAVALLGLSLAGCEDAVLNSSLESEGPLLSKAGNIRHVAIRAHAGTIPDVGSTLALWAVGRDKAGAKLQKQNDFSWTSLNPKVASVDNKGNVTGRSAGIALIVAALGGVADTTEVAVAGGADKARPPVTAEPAPAPDAQLTRPAANGTLPAFPGAEGYGALAKGGRGGRVHLVTHTGDAGAGSLRACVDASGPRTCVFRVGGTIQLRSSLIVKNPYITVAGQTAPGGGIQVRGNGMALTIFKIETHDVVIRYVRARPGKQASKNEIHLDAISLSGGAEDVILDHVSAMFANDEAISGGITKHSKGNVRNVTMQYSLLGNVFESHPTGGMWGSTAGRDRMSNISLHHNVYAHPGYRTPLIGAALRVEAINNVIYNWPSKSAMLDGDGELDLINSYYRTGPATTKYGATNLLQVKSSLPRASAFVAGVVVDSERPQSPSDLWQFARDEKRNTVSTRYRSARPHSQAQPPAVPVTVQSAHAAYDALVNRGDVGAWQQLTCEGDWRDVRDALDARTLADVRDRTIAGGRNKNYPANEAGYGGFPSVAQGSACADADGDGMPDAFERRYGLDPARADDAADADGDGYTNLEEYLNGTRPS